MKTNEIREKYLTFFEGKAHTRCASDVLVPTWDPSVLFTPAGMNQFKDHFLGKVKLDFTRAATCQKCLRTGDIENVGRTAYHHTFFEMLGNFSFGDYFKRDAINWAWEFLTDKQWLGLDPDRLSATVYLDDDKAAGIWESDIKLTPARIERMGEHDNFWPAGAPSEGPDGVCGPCSEIFYRDDFGEIVEIWNLVFTQFNRVGDPPDNLRPLPSKNIDTGMGLERTAACLQGVQTNYHIDILQPIVEAAAEVCGLRYESDSDNGRRLRRITDHIRACTMAVHENVYPGAQKEKYVIRRLLRRAVLDGHQLGLREPFLCQLVPAVVEQMKVEYPDLSETTERVAGVIKSEESNFFGTIDAGLARIEKIFDDMKASNRPTVNGAEAADLYQTYGVPPEVFETMAAESNLAFDWDGYQRAMEAHGEASGKAEHIVMGDKGPLDAIKKVLHDVTFVGYEQTESEAELKFIVAQNQLCDHLTEIGHQQTVTLVLDHTPFYAESGGQVGDHGEIVGEGFRFRVADVQKDGGLILHQGHLTEGEVRTSCKVTARVDVARRNAIRRAHSATHILHHALQSNLGSHAQQQGSKVEDDWLRFDFTNLSPVSPEQLQTIERDSAARIAAAEPVGAQTLPLADARAEGAMMLFGEKYPDPVRMISMGDFSKELCGGTHLRNTAEVGAFEIITEEGVSAGTRRIVALTGEKAEAHAAHTRESLQRAAELLQVPQPNVPDAARSLAQRVRDLKKQLASGHRNDGKADDGPSSDDTKESHDVAYHEVKGTLRETARLLNVAMFDVPARIEAVQQEVVSLVKQLETLAQSGDLSADGFLANAITSGDTKIVVAEAVGANPNLLRQLIDQIRQKADSTAIFLATAVGDSKVLLVAGVSRDLVERGISAGNWVKEVAPVVGGGGGGRPDMAQAGGKNPTKLPQALETAQAFIDQALS
ncbi:MAG: alanine--tRNA ligase [Planctomycetaceae bacterium]|nr:alanine--tRNA ligase [Planctomycetaceae bacterium]